MICLEKYKIYPFILTNFRLFSITPEIPLEKKSNWSIRPNLEGRIVRKLEGQIFNHKAEMIINRKAEFDRKAE